MTPQYSKKIYWLIIISSLLRLVTAALLELGNDEVYYWTYALQPDWNHFDHPPMVGWMIRITTFNLLWVNEVSLRLGSILCAAIASIFIFHTGTLLSNEKTGWYAVIMYQCSVYTSVIAGLFILPDSPQMLFWTASLFIMSKLIIKNDSKNIISWLLLGLMIGLASLSKIHGLYLWVGFGSFLLFNNIKWLLNWRFYLAVFVTLICIIPIFYWNIMNDFITYRFHSERVVNTKIQWEMFAREVGGEIAYQNPILFVLLLISVIAVFKNKMISKQPKTNGWLLYMSLPMILLFWGISLFNPTLPHWSGPGYIPLYFLGAFYLEQKSVQLFPAFLKYAGLLVISVMVAGTILIRAAPINFGSQEKQNYGEYCPTLDLSGWRNFSKIFAAQVKEDIAKSDMKKESVILVDKWFPGGHLEFYTSRESGLPVIGLGKLQDLHKFAWLNKDRRPLHLGDDAYYIEPSNLPLNVMETFGEYFKEIDKPLVMNQERNGGIVRNFYVYRMKNCKKVPKAIL